MSDKLTEIMDWKRQEIASLIRPVSDRELERLGSRKDLHPFLMSGSLRVHPERLGVIAEIKRRSPSAGAIREDANAEDQAIKYVNADADALSVLTDQKFFGGRIQDLWDVVEMLERHSRKVPCLRKDFMVHPVQVVEAAEAGASAILIIVRALDDGTIRDLQHAAELAGMDSLFEVHNQEELDRALRFNPKMVGVNNRDLRRFVTDLSISETLIPQIPDGVIRVSESGIFTVEDAARVRAAGADAILVGQALMEQDDPTELLESFHSL